MREKVLVGDHIAFLSRFSSGGSKTGDIYFFFSEFVVVYTSASYSPLSLDHNAI